MLWRIITKELVQKLKKDQMIWKWTFKSLYYQPQPIFILKNVNKLVRKLAWILWKILKSMEKLHVTKYGKVAWILGK